VPKANGGGAISAPSSSGDFELQSSSFMAVQLAISERRLVTPTASFLLQQEMAAHRVDGGVGANPAAP
jgi:hypothetical protein